MPRRYMKMQKIEHRGGLSGDVWLGQQSSVEMQVGRQSVAKFWLASFFF